MSKRLRQCVASFDYFDKSLTVLFAINSGMTIASFDTVIGAPVGIASASFSFSF